MSLLIVDFPLQQVTSSLIFFLPALGQLNYGTKMPAPLKDDRDPAANIRNVNDESLERTEDKTLNILSKFQLKTTSVICRRNVHLF
jgi:hypothetical protein